MERGPVALFGALVAIGLGPALWLGAQIGDVAVPAQKPPVVQSEQKVDTAKRPGGEGAGAEPAKPEVAPEPRRKARNIPSTKAPSAEPSKPAESAKPEESVAPSPSEEQTTQPPGGETTGPGDDQPGDGSGTGDDGGDSGESPPSSPAQDDTGGGETGTGVVLQS